jgi:alpha-galactosidase
MHPYYAEKPCGAIEALETNDPLYLDAINIVNHGGISNLPEDAIVDIPAVIAGGAARGIHVGELPIGPMELCRRQITIHEMIAKAAHEGDAQLVEQALCLDPYVRSITQARRIWEDFRKEFREELPMFRS